MMEKNRNSLLFILTQVLIWAGVLFLPALINWLVGGEHADAVLMNSFRIIFPLFLIYWLNYLWLVPRFLFQSRKAWFYALNAILILVMDSGSLHPGPIPDNVLEAIPFSENELWAGYAVGMLLVAITQCVFVLLAVGVRQIDRNYTLSMKMEEDKRKNIEAELTWLKNQLNPHFLFNTLNNISSLTQIDPDKAQESIAQLSDLLRYALYDGDQEFVPLQSEVDFMSNYIDLMQLRCNDMTTVEKDLVAGAGDAIIAPMLFISLIENAFKHGVNSRYPSFVKIRMHEGGGDLVFRCSNSMFEKTGDDHIGSGIGLENLRRRLELLYPGAFEYEVDNDGATYSATVIIKGLVK